MLDYAQVFSYIVALGIAAAIPGPGMTALVARSISSGALMGFTMLGGLILGDLVYLSFAVFGLSVLAQHFNAIFMIVKWGAVLYLCYLAWQFWTATHQSLEAPGAPKRKDLFSATISGFTITLGNPKTIAFYLALLPVVINLEHVSLQSWAVLLVPLTALVLLVVGASFIMGALSIRRLLSSEKAQQHLHRGAAAAMLAAAGTMAMRNA